MTLIVSIDDREVVIPVGGSMPFGRAPGPLTVGLEDDRVSRQHGVIGSGGTYWYVHSVSTHYGFTLYDCATPSRIHIPPGAGPLTVPFDSAIVAIEILGQRHHFQVRGRGCANWALNWGPQLRQSTPRPSSASTGQTRYLWNDVNTKGRDGKILQWYKSLVAMCEPRLQNPPVERIPTDSEIARRLGISPKTLEKHRDRLRDELGFNKYDEQMRLAAVVLALGQGLVTAADLVVLDLPGDE